MSADHRWEPIGREEDRALVAGEEVPVFIHTARCTSCQAVREQHVDLVSGGEPSLLTLIYEEVSP